MAAIFSRHTLPKKLLPKLMSRVTYPQYTNRCGWNALLPPRDPKPPLTGNCKVDFAVVGAGYTGLAIARRLAELRPDASIVVLEADVVGEGSAGRNSGFTTKFVLPRNASLKIAETARLQSKYFAEAFDWMMSAIEAKGIDCGLHRAGTIRAAATERCEAAVRSVIEVAEKNKISHTVLTREMITERIGSCYYRFGMEMEDGYLLQPAALVRGLVDILPENVTLYEKTPALKLTRANGWEIQTPEGMVRAGRIALATNGYIRRFGYLKSRMATIFTYAALTEAMSPADAAQLGAKESWGLLPSHRLGTTLRRVGNRLLVRSLYALEHEIPQSEAVAELRKRFIRRWPSLSHVQFEYVWGGTTAFTMNGAPWWGRIDENAYASGGCNGSGITKGTMLGKALAEVMAGAHDHQELCAIMGSASWIAPDPFRTIGFHVISAIERRRAGLES